MGVFEQDMLSALKELSEAAAAMTNGQSPSADDLLRYTNAQIWA